MIHFVPDSLDSTPVDPTPYSEAVSRLASMRQALRLIEGEDGDADNDRAVAAAWPAASDARRARFDDRSERTVAGAAAGIEAIANLRALGEDAHPAATGTLAADIRARLDELGTLFSL